MIEEWRDITWYTGRYQVSSLGRVRRIASVRFTEIIMCTHVTNGYYKVRLRYRGELKRFWVHRLVAQAFIENLDDKPIVNHKDRDRLNNVVSNLEWVDGSENQHHWRHTPKVAAVDSGVAF